MEKEQDKTMVELIRDAATADDRSIWRLARDADIHYPTLYLFIKGDKTGKKHSISIESADKLAKVLGLELRPRRKGR